MTAFQECSREGPDDSTGGRLKSILEKAFEHLERLKEEGKGRESADFRWNQATYTARPQIKPLALQNPAKRSTLPSPRPEHHVVAHIHIRSRAQHRPTHLNLASQRPGLVRWRVTSHLACTALLGTPDWFESKIPLTFLAPHSRYSDPPRFSRADSRSGDGVPC